MTDDAPHVLVVDDDKRLRELLRRYLSENGFRVTTAGNAVDAWARLEGFAFDLIVLDVMMPGQNGLDFTEALRRKSQMPVLMLTAMGEPRDRIRGLERGADDYLPKPFEPRELVLRIQRILSRVPTQPVLEPLTRVRLGAFVFDLRREELSRDGELIKLTESEARLLKVLASHAGEPLERERLAAESEMSGSGRTVDVQVTRLRRKIEPDPRVPRYLQTVRGKGYLLRPD
ncbi:MAG TPA: response regulator transcription factor [Alphaproteobacteria bacterium]|jgi:two-component system, OmpR family, phosphate regulon response regulator OmpR